jgi:hypothetical protein
MDESEGLIMLQREQIMQEALGLPPEDRAFVAAALARSLAADSRESLSIAAEPGCRATVLGGEFLRELQHRSEALHAGRATTHSAADVLADMRRRQAAETATCSR